MPRTTATVSVSLPPEMAAELDRVRKAEHRTRSELVREALRHYIRAVSVRSVQERMAWLAEADPEPDEIAAISKGREQFRVGHYVAAGHAVDRRVQRSRRKKS